jgi:branched-chain amino acid transport system permease protein
MSVRPIDDRPLMKERPSGGARFGAAWHGFANRVGRHRLIPVLVMAVVVAAAPVLFPSGYYYRIFALVYVFALAALGLNLLMGFAGQVSLGHAGFMALGAYAVAIGPAHFGLPGWLSLILGAAFSALVGFLVGRPILRLKGHYLAVATLGFGLLLAIVFTNESDWTGGPDGMAVRRLALFGWVVRGSQTWYWVSGVLFLAGAALAYNLIDSPAGRAMRAIHDSETAASVLGIDVARTKLLVFVISAVYASVAGSSLAFFNGLVTPDVAGFLRSIELVAMVALGGMGSIVGSLVGAAVLVLLPQVLTFLHDYEHMVLGLIIMGVMIFLRGGIVPSIAAAFGGRRG